MSAVQVETETIAVSGFGETVSPDSLDATALLALLRNLATPAFCLPTDGQIWRAGVNAAIRAVEEQRARTPHRLSDESLTLR